MARIAPVTPENVNSKSEQLLQGVEKALGVRPNMLRAMGQSPAVLGAYVGFGQALGGASISGALREQIALTVAGVNSCDYCASAHTLLGKGAGVEEGELADNLRGASSDAKTAAALAFAASIVNKKGFVSDADLASVREAGYGDAEIAEIVATVAVNIFTNYFNHVAQTEIDFPHVDAGETAAAAAAL